MKTAQMGDGYKIRQLKPSDVPSAAALAAKVFNNRNNASSTNERNLTGTRMTMIEGLLSFVIRPRTAVEWETQLSRAINNKLEAQRQARLERLREESRRLRESLFLLKHLKTDEKKAGEDDAGPTRNLRNSESTLIDSTMLYKGDLQAPISVRRKRCFYCNVVEEISSGNIVAISMLSLAFPEAILPAPFPTSKPLRAYFSNLAVDEKHRRKGLASRLLKKSERIAGLWGYEELYLHVDNGNTGAENLYNSRNWKAVGKSVRDTSDSVATIPESISKSVNNFGHNSTCRNEYNRIFSIEMDDRENREYLPRVAFNVLMEILSKIVFRRPRRILMKKEVRYSCFSKSIGFGMQRISDNRKQSDKITGKKDESGTFIWDLEDNDD